MAQEILDDEDESTRSPSGPSEAVTNHDIPPTTNNRTKTLPWGRKKILLTSNQLIILLWVLFTHLNGDGCLFPSFASWIVTALMWGILVRGFLLNPQWGDPVRWKKTGAWMRILNVLLALLYLVPILSGVWLWGKVEDPLFSSAINNGTQEGCLQGSSTTQAKVVACFGRCSFVYATPIFVTVLDLLT